MPNIDIVPDFLSALIRNLSALSLVLLTAAALFAYWHVADVALDRLVRMLRRTFMRCNHE